jgi:hypothetical protein
MYVGRIPACGGDRAIQGSAIAPAPALRAVAAPHPSYPLRGRKTASLPFSALEIAGLPAGQPFKPPPGLYRILPV